MAASKPSSGASCLTSLPTQLQYQYQRWLKRRLPPARAITLEQRRLFIFPTRAGFFFLVALLFMLLAAINYQNNMAYGLTFWLAMLFVVAVHFTHANLLKLTVVAVSARPAFPGQQAEFQLRLRATRRRGHFSIRLHWPGSDAFVDVQAGTDVDVNMFVPVTARGWFHPPRLTIDSVYPLGLLRCWSYVQLDSRVLVWPKPIAPPCSAVTDLSSVGSGSNYQSGQDDFIGFRDYRPGDSLRRVDWRSWAREQPLQTRLLASPQSTDCWLDWAQFPQGDVEQRLSWLCWLALRCEAEGQSYGLRLPTCTIAQGEGRSHTETVLAALALYGVEDRSRGTR